MAFPRKFKERLELQLDDVETPDFLWLAYSVCGCESDSRGWEGWIIDGVFKSLDDRRETSTKAARTLPQTDYDCPNCGRPLFRTSAYVRFEPSEDQYNPARRHEADAGMEYDD